MTIEEMIKGLKNLPPAPRVLPKLLKLLNDMDASTEDIVALIELDASLTAEIIGVSNSAFYGGNGTIAELGEAVYRLGFKEIYRMVTNICAKSFVGGNVEAYQMESEERWFNSVATGLVMEMVSRDLNIGDASVAYTIGLLHDIGKTAMNQVFADQYVQLLNSVEVEGITLKDAERKYVGFDHAEAGAALLKSWDFPDELVIPIQFQYDPHDTEEFRDYTLLLHLSRWIAAGIGGAPGKHAWAFSFHEEVPELLGINANQVMMLMVDSKELIVEKEDMLAL